jgi:hypothetical protein
MGFFNGKNNADHSLVFRNFDGTPSKKNGILSWAATHVVTAASGKNPAIDIATASKLTQSPVKRRLLAIEEVKENKPWSAPRATVPLILPGHTPKITPKKLAFCNSILKGIVKDKKKFKVQLNSCLQDADSPAVARSISKAITVARIQQRKSLKALTKIVIQKNNKIQLQKINNMKLDNNPHITINIFSPRK